MNVGGPSLHVSYLTRELDRRGYETTLVAGRVGEEEGSMSYVAEELGVEPLYVPELQRAISPAPDLAAVKRMRSLIKEIRPHVIHTHTAKAGAVGRMAAMVSGRDRPKVVVHTFHGHVLRGYFDPAVTALFRQLERRPRARDRCARRSQPAGARRPRAARRRARRPDRRDPARPRSRAAHGRCASAPRARVRAAVRHPRGSLRRRLARPDDGDQARRRPDSRARSPARHAAPRPTCCSSATARCGRR